MRFWDVVFLLITTGVSLQWVATAAAGGPGSITAWLVGCACMAVPLALCVVDLSSRYPEEGGMYVWTKRAFGDFSAFLTGWTYWTSNLPYFPGVLYFAAGSALFLGGDRWRALSTSPAYFVLFSLAGLMLATQMNLMGLRVGRWLSNLGAVARWLATAVLIGAGLLAWSRHGPATTLDRASLLPGLRIQDLVFWTTIALALTGLESASFMGDEIHDARRTIPRAVLVAMPAIVLIYVLGTTALLVALPAGEVSRLQGIVEATAALERPLGLTGLTSLLALLLVVSGLGSIGAWLGAVARIPFVAGIDRYLPAAFGRLHPKWGTPHVALLTQSAITVLFILMGQAGTSVKGAYNVLVSTMVVIVMIPFLFFFAAAVRLQFEAARPQADAPQPGAPQAGASPARFPLWRPLLVLAGSVGFLTTSAAIVLSFVPPSDEPNKLLAVLKIAGMTALMTGSGVVVFLWRRRLRR